MPFGLPGAVATFQRLLDTILQPHSQYVAVYTDYIIIYSCDWEKQWTLEEISLTVNPANCQLGFHMINAPGIYHQKGQT